MKNIDIVLELLRDSRWHSLASLKKETPLHEDKLNEILIFLEEQGLVSKEDENLKITPEGLKFLGLPR